MRESQIPLLLTQALGTPGLFEGPPRVGVPAEMKLGFWFDGLTRIPRMYCVDRRKTMRAFSVRLMATPWARECFCHFNDRRLGLSFWHVRGRRLIIADLHHETSHNMPAGIMPQKGRECKWHGEMSRSQS